MRAIALQQSVDIHTAIGLHFLGQGTVSLHLEIRYLSKKTSDFVAQID